MLLSRCQGMRGNLFLIALTGKLRGINLHKFCINYYLNSLVEERIFSLSGKSLNFIWITEMNRRFS